MTMCALFARAHVLRNLHDVSKATSLPGDTVSEKCWFMFSASVVDMLSALNADEHFSPKFNTFKTLSRYLRASTYYATLCTQLTLAPFTIRRNAVTALAQRVASEETLDLSIVPPHLSVWIENFQKTTLEANGPRGQSSARMLMRAD